MKQTIVLLLSFLLNPLAAIAADKPNVLFIAIGLGSVDVAVTEADRALDRRQTTSCE
mgnify:CR=1 FL=1